MKWSAPSRFPVRLALVLGAVSWAILSAPLLAQDGLDPKATREYAVAVGLQNKSLWPQAIARWEKFLGTYSKDPRCDKALHNLGVCQLQNDQAAEAAVTFADLLKRYPQFASVDAAQFNLSLARYNVAVASQKPEDFQTAATAFAETAAKHPKSDHAPTALYYQAECLYSAGQVQQATPIYASFLQKHPQSELAPMVAYALGTAQQQLGQLEEAGKTFAQFVQKFSEHQLADECRLRQGLCLFGQEEFAKAEKLFGPLADKDDFPLADLASLRQAQCVAETDKPEQAITRYQNLLKKFPESKYRASAQLEIGKLLVLTDEYDEAQAPLKEVVSAGGEDAAAGAYWLGRALIRSGQSQQAVATLDQAIKAYPESPLLPHLRLTRIDALYEQPEQRKAAAGQYAEFAKQNAEHELAAQAQYMAALAALETEDFAAAGEQAATFLNNGLWAEHALRPDVLFVAGESRLLDEKPGEAEPFYEELLAKAPEHRQAPQAKVRLGYCQYLAGNHEQAAQTLSAVVGQLKAPELLAECWLLIGRSHGDAEKHAEAVAALGAAAKAKPDWERRDEVLLALAHNLQAQEKDAEAATQLNKLLQSFPQSRLRSEALFRVGQIAERQSKPDEALAKYREVLSQYPEATVAALAAYGVGHVLFVKEDYSGAVEAFSQLLSRYGESDVAPQGRYERGLAYHRQEQFQPAMQDLQAFLGAEPPEKDALDARFALALCQSGLKQFDAAAKTLDELLKDKPDYERSDKALYELAFAQQELEQPDEAAATFQKLATTQPKSPLAAEAWFRVGEHHEENEKLAEATTAYASGLKSATENDAAPPELREKLRFKLGWVEYNVEKFPEAAATFQQQLKDFPEGELAMDARYLAGDALFRENQFQQAAPLFAQVVAAKPEKYHARALYRTGACATGLKQWPAAQRSYQTLISEFPKFELLNEARYGLGLALQNQEKLDEARKVYAQVIEETQTETAAKAAFMTGECHFRERNFDKAIESFVEASVYPYDEWRAMAHFEAGRCFVELKQPQKAIEAFETVVAKHAEHPKAADARRLIASLKETLE